MKNNQSILYLIPKATFYNSKTDVIKEGLASHTLLLEEDRELYTYLLYFNNSTYYSKSVLINNLLANSLFKSENKLFVDNDESLLKIEDALIHNALFNENITHGLKMLLQIKDTRTNNSRTTKVILDFLFNRGNSDFIAIKYKNKIKQLLIHALGLKTVNDILDRKENGIKKYNKLIKVYKNPYDLEVFDFVFDKDRTFNSEYLNEYIVTRNHFKNNTVKLNTPSKLPIEVLSGFNNFYKRNINLTALITVANVSDKQKIQLQNTVKKHSNNTMELKIDLNKYSIMELLKYMYSKKEITMQEIEECNRIIDIKAEELRGKLDKEQFDLANTAIILDISDSHLGSNESKLHPFFKNLALAKVLNDGSKDNIIYVGGVVDEKGLIQPLGDSNLSQGLITATKMGYKKVIVLSDGFENVGSFEKVYKQIQKIGYDLNVLHFNPVFSPKNMSFKAIGDSIPTIPFTSVDDLENLFLFYYLNIDREKFKQVMRSKIVQELLS
jgi:hypothetical protein